jgi:two-component system LytT family response regulator
VITATATHVMRDTLNAVALRLCPPQFVRTHRSEIVNLRHVVRLEPFTHGDGILTLSDGSSAVLSRTFRASFLAQFR